MKLPDATFLMQNENQMNCNRVLNRTNFFRTFGVSNFYSSNILKFELCRTEFFRIFQKPNFSKFELFRTEFFKTRTFKSSNFSEPNFSEFFKRPNFSNFLTEFFIYLLNRSALNCRPFCRPTIGEDRRIAVRREIYLLLRGI